MEIGETLYVTTRDDFRKWLKKNHKTKKEIWLIQYKKATKKPSINFHDAVEEAMCFGWTESIGFKGLDEERYVTRYTPRKAKIKMVREEQGTRKKIDRRRQDDRSRTGSSATGRKIGFNVSKELAILSKFSDLLDALHPSVGGGWLCNTTSGLLDRGFIALVLPKFSKASVQFCSSFQTLRMDGKDTVGVSGSDVQIARWADPVWTLYPSPKSRDHHPDPRTRKRKQRHAGVCRISRQRWLRSLHDRPACARQQ